MAKNWTIETGIMVRTYSDATPDLTVDLHDLFPDYDTLDDAQQGCIVNGEKQKLDDCIARSKEAKLNETEKREAQSALWDRNSVDRQWNMPAQERSSITKKANALIAEGNLTEEQIDVLRKLGIK